MYSIAFPEMLSSSKCKLYKDREATISNLKLLLASDKTELYGDPYYGTNLKKFIYNQNNQVLKDLIIDDIYTNILIFMPQLYLKRSDIIVTTDRIDAYASINCINKIDSQHDLFEIKLTSNG